MQFFKILIPFCFLIHFSINAQQSSAFRSEYEKVHDLVHTKLKVDFNFADKTMNGEAWITLKSHFYTSNKLVLDAKYMLIHKVALNDELLNFNYDLSKISIDLPKKYSKDERFTIYIQYTAQPEKVIVSGKTKIAKGKGLYFINSDGLDTNKPTQIWTHGQPEENSCWFPTLDAPNQKTTQEVYITVPKKYTTLSNGTLVNQIENGAHRTDYWKLDQKHAPYLFFMGIGEYEIIKDSYLQLPVNYYVEKKYAPFAKEIFGLTPEIIGFFSRITGVEYPWSSYNQIVGRDFVAEAMEHTTAVMHHEKAYQTTGQLVDQNTHENIIVHEVFHHWFGNLVTAESWSNIALNESFATYGEFLWKQYKYGIDDADSHALESIEKYKTGDYFDAQLVRYNYTHENDVFDAVSYHKGAAVIRMLHQYIGDDAFYAGLKKYLNTYAYASAEVHQLRLIFEEITGKDLNWFFNQWFFNTEHPKIEVSYDYNPLEKTVTVNILQVQANTFQFPLAIDIFEKGKRTRHHVFVNGNDASFKFKYTSKNPNLILVNADGVLLADFIENKVLSDYVFQLKNAVSFHHKKEALLEIAKRQNDKVAFNAMADALDDDFYKIKILALENIDLINKFSKKSTIEKIKQLANTNSKTLVQAAAIETLGKLTDPELISIFNKGLNSISFAVQGKALVGLYYIDKVAAIKKSESLPNEVRDILVAPLTRIFIEERNLKELPFIANNVISGMYLSKDKTTKSLYEKAFQLIAESNDFEAIKNITSDMVLKGKEFKSFNFDIVMVNLLRKMIQIQKEQKGSSNNKNIELMKTAIAKLL